MLGYNIISDDVILYLSCSPIAQLSHRYNLRKAKILHIFCLVCFWTCEHFKVLLILHITGEILIFWQ
jgi:hypothetical protein